MAEPLSRTAHDDAPLSAAKSSDVQALNNGHQAAEKDDVQTVTLAYDPPGGSIGKLIATLFQKDPKIQARQDLRRLKQLMDSGEIPTAAPLYAAPRA